MPSFGSEIQTNGSWSCVQSPCYTPHRLRRWTRRFGAVMLQKLGEALRPRARKLSEQGKDFSLSARLASWRVGTCPILIVALFSGIVALFYPGHHSSESNRS